MSPDIIAEVAARRARAALRVTPPRITNGPTLFTGILCCGAPDYATAMTTRTGNSGQYVYYAGNAKLTAGAGRCMTLVIRQVELDAIVLSVLTGRILEQERLTELPHAVLERSDAEDTQRLEGFDRVRREKVAAETCMRRLLEMVEEV